MRILFLLVTVITIFSNSAFAADKKIWSPEELGAYLALSNRSENQDFLVKGFVIIQNNCECKPGVFCKPCFPVIRISSKKEADYDEAATDLFIKQIEEETGFPKLVKGEEYIFIVRTISPSGNEVKYLGHKK